MDGASGREQAWTGVEVGQADESGRDSRWWLPAVCTFNTRRLLAGRPVRTVDSEAACPREYEGGSREAVPNTPED